MRPSGWMRKILLLFLIHSSAIHATTWYVRADGGNRNSTAYPHGMCNGQADVGYVTASGATTGAQWTAVTTLALNATYIDTNGNYEKVTTAGTTGTTIPAFPAYGSSGATTADGTAVVTSQGGAPFNQACAYNDLRFMWDNFSGATGGVAWVMAGGDTLIIRGCKPIYGQQNPVSGDCRLGWDIDSSGANPNNWCFGVGNNLCYNPPVPSGTSGVHTRILGGNYAACNTGGATDPKNYESNLTQLFAGFGLTWSFNLSGSQYVDVECIELTTHNKVSVGNPGAGGNCTVSGSPAYPVACHTSGTLDDYAQNGFLTTNTSGNLTFQDVYVHGFDSSAWMGPIGGPVTLTRTNASFNAFSVWNFDDGSDTANGASAAMTISYAYWTGNGCYEQYPIVNTWPARACYDTNSQGFGDTLSGQDSTMQSVTADHIYATYNMKDNFIGPHTQIGNLSITDSYSAGNMGAQWKWGVTQNATVLFQNNLTVTNCNRMTEAISGASQNFAEVSITAATVSGTTTTITMASTSHSPANGTSIFFTSGTGALSFLAGQTGTVIAVVGTSVTLSGITGTDGSYTGTASFGFNGGYLTGFCRAGGDAFATLSRSGTTYQWYGDTIVAVSATAFDLNCGYYTTGNVFNQETNCNTTTHTFKDDNVLGYTDPAVAAVPALYYLEPTGGYPCNTTTNLCITSATYTNEYGIRNGDTCSGTLTCVNPQMASQPATPWPGSEAALDVFNPSNAGNSFYPAVGSPLIGAGTAIAGMTTDYYGRTRPSPPSMGALEYSAPPPSNIGFTVNGRIAVLQHHFQVCCSQWLDSGF